MQNAKYFYKKTHDLGFGNGFMDPITKAQFLKEKKNLDKFDFINTKNLF